MPTVGSIEFLRKWSLHSKYECPEYILQEQYEVNFFFVFFILKCYNEDLNNVVSLYMKGLFLHVHKLRVNQLFNSTFVYMNFFCLFCYHLKICKFARDLPDLLSI